MTDRCDDAAKITHDDTNADISQRLKATGIEACAEWDKNFGEGSFGRALTSERAGTSVFRYADAMAAALLDAVDTQVAARCVVSRSKDIFKARAEKAEAEARKWEWVAKHTYVCPLGEMKPGEPGSYVIEVRPSDALLARYEEAADA